MSEPEIKTQPEPVSEPIPETSFKNPRNILIFISIIIIGILFAFVLSRGLTSVERLKAAQPADDTSLTQMMQEQMKKMNTRTELPNENSLNQGGE